MTPQWGVINHQEGMFPYSFKLIPLKFSHFTGHFFLKVQPPSQYPGAEPSSGPTVPEDRASFIFPFTLFTILGIDCFFFFPPADGYSLLSKEPACPQDSLSSFISLLSKELRLHLWNTSWWPPPTKTGNSGPVGFPETYTFHNASGV